MSQVAMSALYHELFKSDGSLKGISFKDSPSVRHRPGNLCLYHLSWRSAYWETPPEWPQKKGPWLSNWLHCPGRITTLDSSAESSFHESDPHVCSWKCVVQ